MSHVEHETFDAVAQRTSLVEASRAGRSTPPPESTFAKVIGGSRAITLFFPSFFLSHFFPLFQPLPTFFHSTGKVHGSLARAGKVRGQTPKVAKQDKKKLPKVRERERGRERERFLFRSDVLDLFEETAAERSPFLLSFHLFPPSSHHPQGRAMKRIKYNRRFVNVVVGMGKKKSPNSQ